MLGQEKVEVDVGVGVFRGLEFTMQLGGDSTLWIVSIASGGTASGLRLVGPVILVRALFLNIYKKVNI